MKSEALQADNLSAVNEALNELLDEHGPCFVLEEAAVELAETMFNKSRKDHEKGPLGEVVKEVAVLLKTSKRIASQPLDPDVRARKMIGQPAPAFTLEDIDGKEVSLEDYRGKTLMLAFWGYS